MKPPLKDWDKELQAKMQDANEIIREGCDVVISYVRTLQQENASLRQALKELKEG
jgi:hypothetical protein